MKYATANAFRTALEQRLLTRATETNIPLIRLRKLVVFDRLIARLMVVAPDRWVLKGAVALQFRAGPQYRTTKDIDFGRRDSEAAATADFISTQSIDLGDYFSFAIEREGPIALEGGEAAIRYHARAELAGRLFESFVIDVGFGDSPDAPDMLRGPDLLEFAEIAPMQVPVVPLEQHVAEKVHAYTGVYAGGRPSSRVKDLVDLALIASLFTLSAGRLGRAIESTFANRNTRPPQALPKPPAQWRVAYRKMATEAGLDEDIAKGYEQAQRLLDPALGGALPHDSTWDPSTQTWRVAG